MCRFCFRLMAIRPTAAADAQPLDFFQRIRHMLGHVINK